MTVEGLGQAIRALRGERTQREVATSAGLDATTWSFYETGRRQPGAANLEKVLKGLGVPRLELEALAWEHRRRELEGAEQKERDAGSPRFVGVAHQVAQQLGEVSPGDPLRAELRRLLGHIAILVEEVLFVLVPEE